VYRQYLYRALGALGQLIIKIINRLTYYINKLPYTNFMTSIAHPRKNKTYKIISNRYY
jgi:hypothetical protein